MVQAGVGCHLVGRSAQVEVARPRLLEGGAGPGQGPGAATGPVAAPGANRLLMLLFHGSVSQTGVGTGRAALLSA